MEIVLSTEELIEVLNGLTNQIKIYEKMLKENILTIDSIDRIVKGINTCQNLKNELLIKFKND